MSTLETRLEKSLVDWAAAQGGKALKGSVQFDTGYPDRIVYVPGAFAHVEVKGSSCTYHLTDKQKYWAGIIIASKSPYYIVESENNLMKFKELIFSDASRLLVNEYSLNGFQLALRVDASTNIYSVVSYKGAMEHKLMSGVVIDSLAITIYRIFKRLEELFPDVNYEDM